MDLNDGIVHQVFIHNQTTMKFLAVEWYDKPMSFLECLEWLKELKNFPLRLILRSRVLAWSITLIHRLIFASG